MIFFALSDRDLPLRLRLSLGKNVVGHLYYIFNYIGIVNLHYHVPVLMKIVDDSIYIRNCICSMKSKDVNLGFNALEDL